MGGCSSHEEPIPAHQTFAHPTGPAAAALQLDAARSKVTCTNGSAVHRICWLAGAPPSIAAAAPAVAVPKRRGALDGVVVEGSLAPAGTEHLYMMRFLAWCEGCVGVGVIPESLVQSGDAAGVERLARFGDGDMAALREVPNGGGGCFITFTKTNGAAVCGAAQPTPSEDAAAFSAARLPKGLPFTVMYDALEGVLTVALPNGKVLTARLLAPIDGAIRFAVSTLATGDSITVLS